MIRKFYTDRCFPALWADKFLTCECSDNLALPVVRFNLSLTGTKVRYNCFCTS